jgi:hypothetical protein
MIRYDEPEHTDGVVQSFLKFLESDMIGNPDHIRPISKKWSQEMAELIGDIEVDLDEPI